MPTTLTYRGSEAQHIEEVAVCCYGIGFCLTDTAGTELCARLRELLPPEFISISERASVVISYLVAAAAADSCGYQISCNGEESFAASAEEEVLGWLLQHIDHTIARRSLDKLFVHAGVVGWRGMAIVIPGRTHTGKSTLVTELVRLGAEYYSDEFAVLGDNGQVYPYRRTVVLRDDDTRPRPDLHLRWDSAAADSLPIGLIVAAPYQRDTVWRPTILRGARAVLPLIEATVLAQQELQKILQISARVAPSVVTFVGARPDAAETAARLLEVVDDALANEALQTGEMTEDHKSGSLAAVAEKRLRSRIDRPLPAERRLLPARYLRIPDFLSSEEHQELLDYAVAHQEAFGESAVLAAFGGKKTDYGFRKSRTLCGPEFEKRWDLFAGKLQGILPYVRSELALPWFAPGEIERQLTAHGDGGFFAPHRDDSHPETAKRRISCVYYFHTNPRRFSGGELKLYDNWVTPRGSTAAASYTALAPLDNSILFFPSDTFHEVAPVHRETEEFRDSRFTVVIWFREGSRPESVLNGEAERQRPGS